MRNDALLPKRSLAGSGGQLWRNSTGWKLALLGAILCTGLYLLDPPWQWNKQPVAVTAPQHQSVPAPLPIAVHPTPVVQQPSPAVQPTAPPAPMPVARTQPKAGDEPRPVPAGISSQIAIADENCNGAGPLRSPLNSPPPIAGRIVGFVPSAIAMALIPRSEQGANGKLDPAYVHNLRALFRPYDAAPEVHLTVIVPADMNVYVGEDAQMVGGHASPNLACHYVPNLIVAAGSQGG
jgi:hypothetical protein